MPVALRFHMFKPKLFLFRVAPELYSQLWDECKISSSQVFSVDVMIDVDSFSPSVSPQFFYIFPRHSIPKKPSREPVPEAVGTEVILDSR